MYVTLELFEHIEPAVDQLFPKFPHPELHSPLVHEHWLEHFYIFILKNCRND